MSFIRKLLPFRSDIRSNYWFYSYLTDNRDGLIRYLEQHQIQSRPVWKLIHTLKPYAESRAYQIEKALWYYDRIVNIPCSSNLEGESVKRVAERIHSFLKEQT